MYQAIIVDDEKWVVKSLKPASRCVKHLSRNQ